MINLTMGAWDLRRLEIISHSLRISVHCRLITGSHVDCHETGIHCRLFASHISNQHVTALGHRVLIKHH